MPHKNILGLWLSLVLFGAEADGTKELNGILGESVIFKMKATPEVRIIFWANILANNSINIAVMDFREPCHLVVPSPKYQKRLNISKDCRELQFSQLEKEDAGRGCTARFRLRTSELMDESFDLRVFSRLLDSQLRVIFIGDGKGGWQLNCSREPWEDGVKFSWSSDVRSQDPTLGSAVITLAPNVTCFAENLVSKASRTVFLKEAYAEQAETPSGLFLWILLCLSKVGSFLLLGCLGLILRVKSRKAAGGGRPTDSQRNPPPLDPTDRGESSGRQPELQHGILL
ncbi:uncharacterized protein LOC116520059 [Thamnophis elegans]|uniref:uncharacterized protein LOC116520059 n=1 Tax=Thamnophis elegans TaxID=35005 RepID=UPI0013789DF0|nr:uncharacterized protein LOC116520059 [Thamnophis elegans]